MAYPPLPESVKYLQLPSAHGCHISVTQALEDMLQALDKE